VDGTSGVVSDTVQVQSITLDPPTLGSVSLTAPRTTTSTAPNSNTGGGGTPGGSNYQVQYNNSSAFGGASGNVLVPGDVDPVFPLADTNKLATQLTVHDAIDNIPEYSLDVTTVEETKAFNIVDADKGGDSIKDVWVKRNLDDGSDITLIAGIYSVRATVPGSGGVHQARLVDSAGTVLATGTVASSTDTNSFSFITTEFTLANDEIVWFETIHDTDVPDVGLGIGSPFPDTDSVYTTAVFTKLN